MGLPQILSSGILVAKAFCSRALTWLRVGSRVGQPADESPPEFYVRQVDRAGWWEPKDSSEEEIENCILEKVFPPDKDGCVSIFSVNQEFDLRRIAVALNSNRWKKPSQFRYLRIEPDELADLQKRRTEGKTACVHANRLHHDIITEGPDTFRALVRSLKSRRVKLAHFGRTEMAGFWETSAEEHCYAVEPESTKCVCEATM